MEFKVRRAHQLLQNGLMAAKGGDNLRALKSFKLSLKLHITADALTYWAWIENRLGNPKKAIKLCQKAIGRDPDFGNPYNDIGSYLTSLGRADDAIIWFEKASKAKRYRPKQFPHINMGKIYLAKKNYQKSLEQFQLAKRFDPDNSEINRAIDFLQKQLS